MASQTRIRNYKTEKENGQLELWRGLEIVREERLKDTFDILQLAQIFVFCSLPYRRVRSSKLAHFAHLNWPTCTSPDVRIRGWTGGIRWNYLK